MDAQQSWQENNLSVFHNEWIMFDGSRFVFEDGVEPDSWWWANAYEFKCEWYEMK